MRMQQCTHTHAHTSTHKAGPASSSLLLLRVILLHPDLSQKLGIPPYLVLVVVHELPQLPNAVDLLVDDRPELPVQLREGRLRVDHGPKPLWVLPIRQDLRIGATLFVVDALDGLPNLLAVVVRLLCGGGRGRGAEEPRVRREAGKDAAMVRGQPKERRARHHAHPKLNTTCLRRRSVDVPWIKRKKITNSCRERERERGIRVRQRARTQASPQHRPLRHPRGAKRKPKKEEAQHFRNFRRLTISR
mmetsp:Transcript_5219/g.15683  ORF Transcript_5219/g.15683 Transcript_5219/m.15683 type:complete len:246 (-) Transcript_5219:493-1230(-)